MSAIGLSMLAMMFSSSSLIGGWASMDEIRRRQTLARAASRLLSVSSRCARQGFTLVELLVVIGIIGVLVSLLLPAVQMAREAARKMSCQSNMRQIGVALHSYHQSLTSLPPGCIEWRSWNSPPTHRQYAWSAMLLPYLEQNNLHLLINWNKPFDAPENSRAANTDLPIYLCPSEPNRMLGTGLISYGGIYGELLVDREQDDGMFVYELAFRFQDVIDGLSNTIAISEDVGGPDRQWINGRNVFVVAHGINDPTAWVGDNEIRSAHEGGAMVLFADARVHFVSESIDKQLLGSLITRAKQEVIESPF
jgi:prepilin-type N-terminal cleavage/methylation domain-containing protein